MSLFKQFNFNSNEYNPNKDALYFLHIPKTGGTTLINCLGSHFSEQEIFPEQHWNNVLQAWPITTKNIKFIRGHFGNNVDRLAKRPIKKITMLRDPVKRTISQYHHMAFLSGKTGDKWVPDYFIPSGTSLLELVKDPERNVFFTNTQARYLANRFDPINIYNKLINNDNFTYYFDTDPLFSHQPDKDLLAKSDEQLSSFAFVGILEKYNESLLLLAYKFGWEPIINPDPYQITPPKKDMDSDTIDQIKKITKIDKELHTKYSNILDAKFTDLYNMLKEKYYKEEYKKDHIIIRAHKMLTSHYQKTILNNK